MVAAAKSLQSCPTLCDPRDGSPPGSPVPGILQARTLEWLAISFSNAWKWKVKVESLRLSTWKLYSRVRLLATPWTAVYQAPPSMGFSRQEYWSGVPLPSPSCSVLVMKVCDHLMAYSFWRITYAPNTGMSFQFKSRICPHLSDTTLILFSVQSPKAFPLWMSFS